jgi:hypothetical protein
MEVAGLMFERDALNRLQLDAVLVHSSNPTQAAETLLHFLMVLRDDRVTDSFLSALEETDHDLYRCIKDGGKLTNAATLCFSDCWFGTAEFVTTMQ